MVDIDNHNLQARWQKLWKRLGASSIPKTKLIQYYSEPSRAYHGILHLVHCLQCLDKNKSRAYRPDEIELALWYHDAIYDSRAKDNEQKSADLAVKDSKAAGLSDDICNRLQSLILATDHQRPLTTLDEHLIVDIDLAILASEPATFAQYEKDVRFEYSWVPLPQYQEGRAAILQSFLEREQIYRTEAFRNLENQARMNLTRSLNELLN